MWREALFCIRLLLGSVEGMLGRLDHHLENTVVTVTEAKIHQWNLKLTHRLIVRIQREFSEGEEMA